MEINQVTHNIIGCAMQVHSIIGNGFLEIIYQRALAIEMLSQGLTFEAEKEMYIFYKGEEIGMRRADFFVENCVMLEIKATEKIEDIHKNQIINYLEIFNIADGLLINFGGNSLEFKRLYNKKLIATENLTLTKKTP